MTTTECDRCGCSSKYENNEPFYEVDITSKVSDQRLDLCVNCYNEFVHHFIHMNSPKETVSHE